MFGSLWAALLGGGPAEWGALALGFFLVTGGAFAGGVFYEANHIASKGTTIAVAAQHKQDVKQHNTAVIAGKQITIQHATADKKAQIIIKTIHDLKTVTVPGSCDLTPDTLKLLNDAGHQ